MGRISNSFLLILTLCCGAAGGMLFAHFNLPLPWMLGALFATMTASLLGLRLHPPKKLRHCAVMVIGLFLGAGFTPDLFSQAGSWLISLSVMALYLGLSALCIVPFYRFIGGFNPATAYFAGMPGGLAEIIELAEKTDANLPGVILAQSLRIIMTVGLIALWFRWWQGYDINPGALKTGFHDVSLQDYALFLLCIIIGVWAAIRLRLPAPMLLGPMILSAMLHLSSLSQSAPPSYIIIAAQIIIGCQLGCRFYGIPPKHLAYSAGLGLCATEFMLLLAFGFALMLAPYMSQGVENILLAFAPGGLTETSLVALAIHADIAFVALHHIARIFLVVLGAPLCFRLFLKAR